MENKNEQCRETLREVLRTLRVLSDYSQEQLTASFAMARSTYSYYETGRTTPDIFFLKQLADFYQIPMEMFFDREFLSHLGTAPPRPHRKIRPDPVRIGELTPSEKELIALLRKKSRCNPGSGIVENTLRFVGERE